MVPKQRNPFINALVIDYIAYVVPNPKSDPDPTHVYGYMVDVMEHTRVYTSKAHRELIFKLSDNAQKLYLFIFYSLNYNYQYVLLPFDKVAKGYKRDNDKRSLSKRTWHETICELVSANVIDLKEKETQSYWINPILFFAGDRLEMFPQCGVKAVTQRGKEPQLLKVRI